MDGNHIHHWSEEIKAGKSTSEQPSSDLKLQLQDHKWHRAEKKKMEKEATNQQGCGSSCSQSNKMIATMMSMATAIMVPHISQLAIITCLNQTP